jgi:hypothetical protein
MNIAYSKENIILESIRNILINDTVNVPSGYEVKNLSQYISSGALADRVVRKQLMSNDNVFPMITISVESNVINENVPSSEFTLIVTAHIKEGYPYLHTTLANMATRINYLLGDKKDLINSQFPNKKLKCVYIKSSAPLEAFDSLFKIYSKHCFFRIVVLDEIVSCD